MYAEEPIRYCFPLPRAATDLNSIPGAINLSRISVVGCMHVVRTSMREDLLLLLLILSLVFYIDAQGSRRSGTLYYIRVYKIQFTDFVEIKLTPNDLNVCTTGTYTVALHMCLVMCGKKP